MAAKLKSEAAHSLCFFIFPEQPVQSIPADAQLCRDLYLILFPAHVLVIIPADFRDLNLFASLVLALALGNGDAFLLTLKDHGSLKFSDGGEHGHLKLPGRSGCIEAFLQTDQVRPGILDLLYELEQVGGRSAKPGELGHINRVPFPDVLQHFLQLRTVHILP